MEREREGGKERGCFVAPIEGVTVFKYKTPSVLIHRFLYCGLWPPGFQICFMVGLLFFIYFLSHSGGIWIASFLDYLFVRPCSVLS